MARCIEEVTRRWSGGGGSYKSGCTNPGEFAVRRWSHDERSLPVCRTHLPVLVKRLLLDPRQAKIPLTVTLVIHEEEGQ